MPLHHYLPASFLARFSADSKTEPARGRLLIVGDKKNGRLFKAAASKVGCIKNLYTLADNSADPEMIDKTWAEYEARLPSAIDDLIRGNVEAETWARVLVPFVTCMLVRGPDFSERFDQRWPPNRPEKLSKLLSNDNANMARLIDLQRLLGFVATAKWLVLTTHGEEKLITNDLGYSPFVNPKSSDRGMAVPLGLNKILAVIPTIEHHPVLREEANKWVPVIRYLDEPVDSQQGLNKSISHMALRFIFGMDEAIVEKYIQGTAPTSVSLDPIYLGFPDSMFSRAHEFTWHQLVGAIRKLPSDKDGWDFPLDWKVIASGWHSFPCIPMNLVKFPPALKRVGNTICTRYYNPEIYYRISQILMLEETGHYDTAIEESTDALAKKLSPTLRARILAIRGTALVQIGKNRKAIKDFEDAITIDRSNPDLYANYSFVLLKAGNMTKAFRILSRAIELEPNHGIAYANRGLAQWKLGHLNEALNDCTTAINLLPDGDEKAGAFFNRGKIHGELGMQEQSNEDFAQAEKLFKIMQK